MFRTSPTLPAKNLLLSTDEVEDTKISSGISSTTSLAKNSLLNMVEDDKISGNGNSSDDEIVERYKRPTYC